MMNNNIQKPEKSSVAINKFSYTQRLFLLGCILSSGIGGYQMNQQKALELYRSFIKHTIIPDSVKKVKMVENAKQFIYELEHPTLNKLKKILGKLVMSLTDDIIKTESNDTCN